VNSTRLADRGCFGNGSLDKAAQPTRHKPHARNAACAPLRLRASQRSARAASANGLQQVKIQIRSPPGWFNPAPHLRERLQIEREYRRLKMSVQLDPRSSAKPSIQQSRSEMPIHGDPA
jgi:hypothetical protein